MSIRKIILILLLTSSFISIVITGMVWLFAELNTVKKEKMLLREISINNQKQALKGEVSRVFHYIEIMKQISADKPDSLIQKEILTYISSIRFGNDGYVFVNTFNGNALAFDGNLIKGKKDISDMTDPNGLKIFQLELEAIQNPEGGFIDYMFKKMTDTIPQAKISYIGSYTEWEWIIGAGDYYDNLTAEIEKIENKLLVETKTRIRKILTTLLIISFLLFLYGVLISKKIREQHKIFSDYLLSEDKDQEQKFFKKLTIKELKDTGFELKSANRQTKQFADIIDQSLNEIYIFDSETLKFLYVNQGAELNIGYTQDELIKLSPLGIKPEIDSKEFEKLLSPLKSGEKSQIVFETFHQRKNKTLYPVEAHLQRTVFNEKDAFIAIILDISKRKQSEILLVENKNQLELIIDKMPGLIAYVNNNLEYLYVNKAYADFYNKEKIDFIGTQVKEVLQKLTYRKAQKHIERVLKGEEFSYENVFLDKIGQEKIARTEYIPHFDENNNVIAYLAIIVDITERKDAEHELARYQNSLEELVKERTSVIVEKNKELTEKNKELEKYHELFVGREFRMKELKDEIKLLKNKLK